MGKDWSAVRRWVVSVAVAVATVAGSAAPAAALEDTWGAVVSAGTAVQSTNLYHTYVGIAANVNYGTWVDSLCAKGLTRDGTIRNGNHPCGFSGGGSYVLGWNTCLPTGEPTTIGYSYYTGLGGYNYVGGRARTGSCY